MNGIVQTNSLCKRYGSLTALEDCSFTVTRGEVFGLLGPNGAGKTTLIRLLMGFLKPSDGSATIEDLDCYRDCVQVHQMVSYLPGDARLFRTMRGKDVLSFFAQVRSDSDIDRAKKIADRLELDLSRWVGFMSTGMRQKLALSVVLAVDAPLLILDEPTANLDPNVRGEIMTMVAEAKAAGKTVLFSSHVLSEVEDVCDRVGVLRGGRLAHIQSMDHLKRQHRITALTKSELPAIPEELKNQISIMHLDDDRIQIETPGELSVILHWLASASLQDVYVQPVGLRSVYDQYHREPEIEEV